MAQSAASPPPAPAEPARTGGLAEPIFDVTADLGGFGRTEDPAQMLLLGAALPPPQRPMHRQSEMARGFAAEHTAYPAPGGAYAYAVPGARIWGHGLVTLGRRFVAPPDCTPAYLRGQLATEPHSLHPKHAGPVGRGDLTLRHADLPVAAVWHPNLHYPRFLLEIFPRLYAAALLRSLGAAFALAVPSGLPGWALEFVDALGLDGIAARYDAQTECLVAPSVILPPMLHTDYNFHPALNLAAEQVVQRAGRAPSGAPAYLYLARSIHAERRIDNEEAVAAAMAQLGFTVVQSHKLTLTERVRLLSGAQVVAGEYGAALHDAMFAPPGTRIVAINFANNYQSRLARVRRQALAYVPPSDGLFRHWSLNRGAAPNYTVDLAVLRGIVREMAPELG